ncbi:GEVED domain-containing protein [Flavobacterium gelidilacus]|uniref:GEVED domain-containing protein n=1 Tax=Flavobacterium gelidilacus TaxID=206041 RepID=UPI00042334BE|nr:GEVED domain-containing protein [Flavobacterium gelidilacus]
MKKITLLILALFAFVQVNAQLWTINSCSNLGSTTYGPMNTLATANSNSRKAVIYPSSQLTNLTGQVLNSMYFQRSTTTGTIAGTPNFKIYLKEVAATDWGASAIDWATTITGATLVYDSNPAAATGSDAGWKSFQFATNFTYSGTQNLAVFMEYYNATASTSISWNYEYTAPCSTTTNSNTTKYNNNTTGTLATSLASTDFRRPLIGFDFVVSCNAPNSLVTSNLGTTFVDVAWTENAVQPQNGYEYYYSTSNTAPLPATVPTGTTATGVTTTSLTSLTPATTYYMWVRGNCGASDKSIWAGPISFTTLCVDVAAFVENFDTSSTGSGNLPVCWSKAGTSANVYNTTASVAPMSPANKLYMNISATTTAFAIMPPVSNLQANTHRLRFKTYCTTANKVISVGYFTTPGDATTYVELEPFQMPSTVVANTQEFTVIPTGVPAGITQLVFNLVAGATTTAYIDDVKWEVNSSCVEPSALTATMITNSSATLGWTNGGSETIWDIQYGLTGFSLGSGTILNGVTTNPYVLNGLIGSTSYQFYVRGVCSGPENSSWFGPFLFKTQCDDVTDYFENFEAYPSSTTSLPDCWSRGGTSTSTYITTGAVAPMSPTKRLYMFASGTTPTEGYAVLPAVSNLQANTHRLKFKAYATTLNRFMVIGYLTDPTDMNTFIQLEEIYLPGTTVATTQEFTVIPGVLPVGVKHLCIKNPGFPASSTTFYVDDVAWEPIPSCVEPSFLVSTMITNNTASIGWTEGATATQWEIEYGTTGFAQGTGTVIAAPTNPFILTSLTSNTSYDFYVRAVCSSSDSSTWTGPSAFKTQCDDVTDYTENFDSFPTGSANPIADCWSRGGTGSAYLTTGAVSPMSPANRLYMFASGTANPPTEAYAILPAVSNLQANTHRLRFKGYATLANRVLQVGYLTDPSDVSTFVLLQDVTLASTVIANTQEYVVVPTGIPAGVKHLALKNPGFTASSASMYLDDFAWELLPVIAPSCTINIVATPDAACGNFATSIAWDAAPLTDGYKLTIGTTSGGIDVLNNVDVGNVTSYSIVGTFNTTYYYKVVPFNSVGDATGCVEQSFTTFVTGCTCSPIYTTGISSNDLISNVVITGTTLSNNSGTASTGPYYTYFTGQPNYTATLQPGVTYDLVVTIGSFGSQNVAVWIDFNDDLTFSASERMGFTTTSILANGSGTIQLPIPCSAQAGLHKMRVRDVWNTTGSLIDPCASYGYGEAEDYDITINALTTPSGSATQSISVSNAADATIEDLVVTPMTVSWYLSQADALANTNVLTAGTQLIDNTTYYAVNFENGCSSAPFAVTVAVVLGVNGFDATSFVAYPNPVNDILNLSYTSNINSVKVINLLGQVILSKNVENTSTQLDLSSLNDGAYIVNVTIGNIVKTIKVIKN